MLLPLDCCSFDGEEGAVRVDPVEAVEPAGEASCVSRLARAPNTEVRVESSISRSPISPVIEDAEEEEELEKGGGEITA